MRIPCSVRDFSASSQITGSTSPRFVTSRFHICRSIAFAIPARSIISGYQGGFQGSRIIGRRSKPSTSIPPSSLSAKLAGPSIRSQPCSRSQPSAAVSSASSTSSSCSNSRKPNQPQRESWWSLKAWLTWAVTRPTTRPSRRARKYSPSPCVKNAFSRLLRNSLRSSLSGGTHSGWLACNPKGRSMKARRSRPPLTAVTSTLTGKPPYMPTSTDVFAKVKGHEREELLRAAREADVLPYFHVLTSPAMPVVEMEGAERIMLGSNNYLGLTGDERVLAGAEQALHRYGTGLTGSRLLNGTIPLHLELEEEIAQWMGTESALVFSTGHQANLGALGTLLGPGDTVIVDSADHASILDGCLLSRAKLRPFRHNRLDKLEKMLQRAQSDGGGVLVVVDGVFSMEGDIAPLHEICELCERYGARLMVDEAHGAGVLGAAGAGTSELLGVADRVDLRIGTFSKSLASCGGFVAGTEEVIDYLRISSRAFLFTASAVPAAVGAALAALR